MKFKINFAADDSIVCAFESCSLNVDRLTGEVRKDSSSGLDKYRVHALVKEASERTATPITVNIAAKSDPCAGLKPFDTISFVDLTLGLYQIDNASVQSFSATAVKKA